MENEQNQSKWGGSTVIDLQSALYVDTSQDIIMNVKT